MPHPHELSDAEYHNAKWELEQEEREEGREESETEQTVRSAVGG